MSVRSALPDSVQDASAPAVRGDRRALVIEDDRARLSLVADVLCAQGFEVYPAGDGAQGLERYWAVRPDLVILDIRSPKVDGWPLLERLHQCGEVPVVLLATGMNHACRLYAEVMGAADCITEPLQSHLLATRLLAVMEQAEHRRSLHR